MAELVSPCCGQEYSDDHIPRSMCCGAEQKEDSDLCSDCLEHTDFPQYMCEICHEDFEEPEEDYEYNERMKEYIAEDRADEKRDLGW